MRASRRMAYTALQPCLHCFRVPPHMQRTKPHNPCVTLLGQSRVSPRVSQRACMASSCRRMAASCASCARSRAACSCACAACGHAGRVMHDCRSDRHHRSARAVA
jgi:hypothetical protein